MKKYLFFITFFTIFINAVKAQDSIKLIPVPSPMLSCKISSSFLSGEVPLLVEYRPIKNIGNLLSLEYVYANYVIHTSDLFGGPTHEESISCSGYKIGYGLRIYFNNDKNKIKKKNRWWYISPQIIYKNMQKNNLSETYWKNGPGGDSRLEMYYNENRQILGGELLFGFTKTKRIRTFEFYFGVGYRRVNNNQENVKFKSYYNYWENYDPNNLPKSIRTIYRIPTIQIGCNWSFQIIKRKND